MKTPAPIRAAAGWIGAALFVPGLAFPAPPLPAKPEMTTHREKQITSTRCGHILTNTRVWSPDGEWIVFDTRSTPAGESFDGELIQCVRVATGETRTLYHARAGACCGVATFHPRANKVAFILGPENPTADWQYSPCHRQGVIVDFDPPGATTLLDACQLSPPFTPGALRGGSHVHVWDSAGQWISFTYEDHLLSQFHQETADQEINLRNVGVSVPVQSVTVRKDHPRNHDGTFFSVLVTRTVANPEPGSDAINKAFEEGWIGTHGYVRADGRRQEHALAFQGQVLTRQGRPISEVFVVDLPPDVRIPAEGPLAGTSTRRPRPPKGTTQRRLTFTAQRKYPGLQGPRHWLRSSPDGAQIAFLMKDELGVVQLWTVPPTGGPATQLTHNDDPIGSAFTWSPDGKWIAHVLDNTVCATDSLTGKTRRLTQRRSDPVAPRPEACVFSPDGKQIAYLCPVWMDDRFFNQIFVVPVGE